MSADTFEHGPDGLKRNTHLLSWLEDGYTHCRHGTQGWCEAYLKNARDVIMAQDDRIASLEAERDDARRQRDEIGRAWDEADARAKEWMESLATLTGTATPGGEKREAEAERDALRVALAPFAKEAEAWVGYDETEPLTEGFGGGPSTQLNVGHLRRAARALSGKAPKSEDKS